MLVLISQERDLFIIFTLKSSVFVEDLNLILAQVQVNDYIIVKNTSCSFVAWQRQHI